MTTDQRAFPTLDENDLQQLRKLAACESYQPGETVLSFGQADVDLIVVESGAIEIRNPGDGDRTVTTHRAGGFVGDIDLLTRRPIIFNAIAVGVGAGAPTRVLRVPGSKLRDLLNTVPSIGEKMMIAFQVRRELVKSIGLFAVRVIGPGGCGHTNRIREFLHKNFVPFSWVDSDTPDGHRTVEELGSDKKYPLVDCGKGKLLMRPKLTDVAESVGVWRGCPSKDVDLAIVGAGPAGIAAAVYAASEGLKTVVLDRLGPGGQAGGSSKIENFIGFPAGLSGNDLATRGVLQMLKFGASMIAPVEVQRLDLAPDDASPHLLHLDCGTTIRARTVLASTGVAWRRLPAKNADRFERAGVYYACTAVEARLHDDCDVAVVGAGNSAGQAVMFLAESCRQRKVHHLIRRRLGIGMSDYLVRRIRSAPNVVVHEGVETEELTGEQRLESARIVRRDSGENYELPLAAMFVFIGAEPHADWLPPEVQRDGLGYILTGTDAYKTGKWPLSERDPCPLETTVPRILAGGDVRAGSTKRVGFAVGDGSLAVTCAHRLAAHPT